MMNFAQIGILGNRQLDIDYSIYLNELQAEGVTLSGDVIAAQNEFVRDVKSVGLWDRMRRGLFLHSGGVNAAKVDLRFPVTKKNTLSGNFVFSEGNGLKSNGTTGYIIQNYFVNEISGAHINSTFVDYISESKTTGSNNEELHGARTSSTQPYFLLFRTLAANNTDTVLIGYSSVSNNLPFTPANHKGLYVQSLDPNGAAVWKDGSLQSAVFSAFAADVANNRFILAFNNSTSGGLTPIRFYQQFLSCDFIFDTFNSTDELNFRTIWNKYRTTLSIP